MTDLRIFRKSALVAMLVALMACSYTTHGYLPQTANSTAATTAAAKPRFTIYRIPKILVAGIRLSTPLFVGADASDNAWFGCLCGGLVSRVTPGGKFKSWTPYFTKPFSKLPYQRYEYEAYFPTLGPAGLMWFEFPHLGSSKAPAAIGSVDQNGNFAGWIAPSTSFMDAFTADKTRAWFTQANLVAYSVTANGIMTPHPVGIACAHAKLTWLLPIAIDAKSQAWSVWGCDNGSSQITNLIRFHGPNQGGYRKFKFHGYAPATMILGPGNDLWFNDQDGYCGTSRSSPTSSGIIVRIAMNASTTKFCLPKGFYATGYEGIAYGTDGAIWFIATANNHYYLARAAAFSRLVITAAPTLLLQRSSLKLSHDTQSSPWDVTIFSAIPRRRRSIRFDTPTRPFSEPTRMQRSPSYPTDQRVA